jgi:hypothetical protein
MTGTDWSPAHGHCRSRSHGPCCTRWGHVPPLANESLHWCLVPYKHKVTIKQLMLKNGVDEKGQELTISPINK